MRIHLLTTSAEMLFPSTTWILKRWELEENLEGINLSSRHKYDPQAHKHRVAIKIQRNGKDTFYHIQGCIFRLTCSYPELTEDHVLTSAYVKIFRTVTRNAVNKSV